MSGVSAKRLGMAQGGMELEQRLRRIEQEIEKKADANINVGVSSRSRLIPLQIEGLAIIGGIQCWRLSWNPIYASDLAKYEVHISDTITFNTFTVYDVTTNYFEYTLEPDPLVDVPLPNYVRVRAITLVGFPGLFSDTFDVTTGKLATADFEQGAVTGLVEWEMMDGLYQLTDSTSAPYPYDYPRIPPLPPGTPPLPPGWIGPPWAHSNPETEDQKQSLGPIYFSGHAGAVVLPYLTFEAEVQAVFGQFHPYNTNDNKLDIVVKRRISGEADTVISSMQFDFLVPMPVSRYYWTDIGGGVVFYPWAYVDTQIIEISVPMVPDQPGAGEWEYRIDLEVTTDHINSYCMVWPRWMKFKLLEFKR